MKQRWAAEPWKASEGEFFIKGEEGWGSIVNSADWFIAKIEDSLDPEANAGRIVSCVNACRGLDPEALAAALEALEACVAALGSLAGPSADAALREQAGQAAAKGSRALRALKLDP